MDKTGGVVAILGGVALLYLAYTGYLDSAWKGLTGKCDGSTGATGDSKPQAAGEAGHYYASTTGALMWGDAGSV